MRRLVPLIALSLLGCPSEEECAPQAYPGPTPVSRAANRVRSFQVWIGGHTGGAIGPDQRYTRLSLSAQTPEPLALVHEAAGACGAVGCSAAHREALAALPVGGEPAAGLTLLARAPAGALQLELTHLSPGRLVLVRLGPLDPAATLVTHAWARGTQCGAPPQVNFAPVNGVNAVCGDGLQDGAEACDDGNDVEGDGCSAGALTPNPAARVCQVEAPTCDPERAGGWQTWICGGEPSRCEATACFGDDGISGGACRLTGPADPPDHTVIPVALGRLTAGAEPPAEPVWIDTGAAQIPCPLQPGTLSDSPTCVARGRCLLIQASDDTAWRGCLPGAAGCALPDPLTPRSVLAARPVGPQTLRLVAPVPDPQSPSGRNANAARVAQAFGHTLTLNRSGRLTMRRADGQAWDLALSPSIEALTPRPDGGAWVVARLRQRYHDGQGEHVPPVADGDGLVVQPVDPEGRPGRPQVFGREGALRYQQAFVTALPAADGTAQALVGLSGTADTEAWLLGVRADGRPGVDRGLGRQTRLAALTATAAGAVVAVQGWGAVDGEPTETPGTVLLGLDPSGGPAWRTALPGDPNRPGHLAWAPDRLVWLGAAGPGAAWVELDPTDGTVRAERGLDLPACAPLLGLAPTADGGLLAARAHCDAYEVAAVTRWAADGAEVWTERLANVGGVLQVAGLTVDDDTPQLWGTFTGPGGAAAHATLAP